MQYYCQACLKIDHKVHKMTSEEVHFYMEFICKNTESSENSTNICAMCRCVLRKLIRFVRQCELSQRMLRECIVQDTRLYHQSSFLSLEATTPAVIYVGPEQVDVKVEDVDGFGSDEDDVPLVMLSGSGECDDEANDGEKSPELKLDIKQESKARLNGHKKKRSHKEKKRVRKKELREGFTSRMVQETDEYVVIKLSKEQVLEEMALNTKSERYVMSPYKCEKCVKGFNFEDVLRAHLIKHSPEHGTFQCELCTQYCASAVSLRGHMKSHTTRYKCKVCGIVRLSRQHIVEHHGISHTAAAPAYSCDQCGFTTNKRTVIQHHVRTHNAREPHACHQCGKLYKNLETLRIHIMRHDKKRHQCPQCKLNFIYASQLNKHVRCVHERRDFYCVECDVVFKSKDTLKLHFQRAKRHRDASSYKYKCPECPQRFPSQSTLSTHLTSHGVIPRLSCTQCGARSFTAAALRGHLRRVHGVTACRQCGGSRKSVLLANTAAEAQPRACACAFAQPDLRAHKADSPKDIEETSHVENGHAGTTDLDQIEK